MEETRKYSLSMSGPGKAFDGIICECEDLEILPLTYKTDWYNLESVLNSGKLPCERCNVFDEELGYFFYGRPAYKIAQNIGNRKDNVYFPVCFLLNPSNVSIYAVFPFDSGAYADGRYDDYLHKEMDINSFLLKSTIPYIKGFIKKFYGDNYKYYTGKTKPVNPSFNYSSELNAYINLLTAKVSNKFDERSDTIEIISKIPVDLAKTVMAIVIPDDFLEVERCKKKLVEMQDLGIEIITYPIMGLSPEQYNGIISFTVLSYLKKKGVFEKG